MLNVHCTYTLMFDFEQFFFSIFPSISVFGLKFFNFPFNFDENDEKATKDQLGYHFYFWMEGMVKHFARLSKNATKKEENNLAFNNRFFKQECNKLQDCKEESERVKRLLERYTHIDQVDILIFSALYQ